MLPPTYQEYPRLPLGSHTRDVRAVADARVWSNPRRRSVGAPRAMTWYTLTMPQLEFTAGLLDEPECHPEPEESPDPEAVVEDLECHPHDRAAYEAFARAMGWAVEWWELGTDRDIPGPGRRPFVLAFRKVRELIGQEVQPAERVNRPAPTVDHWAEWLKAMAARKKAKRRR